MQTESRRVEKKRGVFLRGVRVIASYIAMHPVPFAISLTGATIYALATVGSSVILGRVTDEVIYPAFRGDVDPSIVWSGVAAVVGVIWIRAASIIVRRYFAGMVTYRTQRTLRTKVVDRYRELPLAWHRSKPTGELLAHAEADVQAATEVLNPVPFGIAVVMLVIFAIVTLLVTDLFLAIIGLLILPVLTLLNRIYGTVVEPAASRAQERIGDISTVAHESIDGALVIKTLGREASEVSRLDAKAEQLQGERTRMGFLRANFEPAFEALPNLGIVVLLAVGAWRLSTGAVTVGTLVQFMSLFQLLAFPMRLIGFLLGDMPRAVVGRERIYSMLHEPVELLSTEGRSRLHGGALGVAVKHVGFSYDGYKVLDDLSFDVSPNESVALVGPTGVGKSTLAQLMVRLADPERGSIEIGDVDLRDIAPGELQRAASVVFQRSF
ncbi:MAG: ABC transporter ATP-binding protein, partial [Actinomycetota bacterium]